MIHQINVKLSRLTKTFSTLILTNYSKKKPEINFISLSRLTPRGTNDTEQLSKYSWKIPKMMVLDDWQFLC